MSLSLASTLAAAGLTASLAVGGVTAVLTAGGDRPDQRRAPAAQRLESAADHLGDAIPATDASVAAKTKARRNSGQVEGRVSGSPEDQRARASVSAPGAANAVIHGGASGSGVPLLPPGSGGSGPGGSYSPDLPDTAPPSVPSLSQLSSSASAEGSYTVVVPPTGGTSKELCLKGEVNRCKTITVPATPGRTIVLRWAGNAATTRPSFDIGPCRGGLEVTVSGLASGTSLSVAVDGHEVSRTVTSRERSQTASLCDA